jgi:hypothetical protein
MWGTPTRDEKTCLLACLIFFEPGDNIGVLICVWEDCDVAIPDVGDSVSASIEDMHPKQPEPQSTCTYNVASLCI